MFYRGFGNDFHPSPFFLPKTWRKNLKLMELFIVTTSLASAPLFLTQKSALFLFVPLNMDGELTLSAD